MGLHGSTDKVSKNTHRESNLDTKIQSRITSSLSRVRSVIERICLTWEWVPRLKSTSLALSQFMKCAKPISTLPYTNWDGAFIALWNYTPRSPTAGKTGNRDQATIQRSLSALLRESYTIFLLRNSWRSFQETHWNTAWKSLMQTILQLLPVIKCSLKFLQDTEWPVKNPSQSTKLNTQQFLALRDWSCRIRITMF